MIENPLSNILIQSDAIDMQILENILKHINSPTTIAEEATVLDLEKTNETGETHWIIDKQIRDVKNVSTEGIYPQIEQMILDTINNIINPFYQVEVDKIEPSKIRSYGVGGHHQPHVDGETLIVSEEGEYLWKKHTDRDLSIVFFLNDDFEGGDLVFPELKISIRPESGMVVCFPSDHNYIHGVEPVIKGNRYSIVSWVTVKNTQEKL